VETVGERITRRNATISQREEQERAGVRFGGSKAIGIAVNGKGPNKAASSREFLLPRAYGGTRSRLEAFALCGVRLEVRFWHSEVMATLSPANALGHVPTAIDLFAGCGGLTLGLKQAGFRILGAIELSPLAAATYVGNHPEVTVWNADIRRVRARAVLRKLNLKEGELDLLAACPPCEGFSCLRTLNGGRRVRDCRNDLVLQLVRFVRAFRPKAVMMENVPGLMRNRRFGVFRTSLERLGYRCNVAALDAADYGVPQRRRRMILLAGLGHEIQFGRLARSRRTVRDAIADLARTTRRRRDKLHREMERRGSRVKTLIKSVPKDGGSRADLPARFKLKCHKMCDGFKDVYGRMRWDDVAPTITSGCVNPSKGRFLHPSKDRAITLREAAILQSFPRRYFFSLEKGKFAVAEMIGNALPPEFIRRHALSVSAFIRTVRAEKDHVGR
jgi:DNA (cytosine-5)-methyltransferase 1